MTIERVKKRWILALLVLVTLATLLVAAGLSSIQLQPGMPFPSGEGAQDHPDSLPEPYASEVAFRPASRGIVWIIPALLFLILIYLMFRQMETRRILYGVLILSLFIGLVVALFGDPQARSGLWLPPQEAPSNITIVEPLGSAPTIFIWLAIGGFVLLAAVFGFWSYRATFKAISAKKSIQAEAENALKEINDGEEWSNVIVRCYLQMVQAVQVERDIERGEAMTAHEFKRVLVSHGFPGSSVHRLTTLFEKVRYGNKQIDVDDEQTAVECLRAITSCTGEKGDQT